MRPTRPRRLPGRTTSSGASAAIACRARKSAARGASASSSDRDARHRLLGTPACSKKSVSNGQQQHQPVDEPDQLAHPLGAPGPELRRDVVHHGECPSARTCRATRRHEDGASIVTSTAGRCRAIAADGLRRRRRMRGNRGTTSAGPSPRCPAAERGSGGPRPPCARRRRRRNADLAAAGVASARRSASRPAHRRTARRRSTKISGAMAPAGASRPSDLDPDDEQPGASAARTTAARSMMSVRRPRARCRAAPPRAARETVPGPIVGRSTRRSWPGLATLTSTPPGPDRRSAGAAAEQRVGAFDRLDAEHHALLHDHRLADVERAERRAPPRAARDVDGRRGVGRQRAAARPAACAARRARHRRRRRESPRPRAP